ncbi:MAG: PhnA domain-containing protein [Crocinitomicaceae bacterium]|nr:PhnA domain-containing protein [Crocinitomicaceae bacterium]
MLNELSKRSNGNCELCGLNEDLNLFIVSPKSGNLIEECIHICNTCYDQLGDKKDLDPNHWRCLNESMWSEIDAVKVVTYRVLHELKHEGWPTDLIEMFYMEEDVEKWAKSAVPNEDVMIHLDSNGAQLYSGDTVVLIKDLKVKGGGNFTAKRGTAVRNISLVHDNAEHIEGRVEGIKIVILTKYVKK